MTEKDLLRLAVEHHLDLLPKYRKHLFHLKQFPDDETVRERLRAAIEQCRQERAGGDVLSPHPDSTCGISSGDTPLAFQVKTNAPVRFDFARLPGQSHTTVMSAITGLQDSGKSTAGMVIARGVAKLPDVAVWCIDPSGALHRLLESDIERFAVVRPGAHFRVNPFDPGYLPPGTSHASYLDEAVNFAAEIVELLARHYERHDSRFLLNNVVEYCIRAAARHWNGEKRPLPSLSTIIETLGAPLPDSARAKLSPYKAKEFAFSSRGVLSQLNRKSERLFDASWSNALPRLLSRNLILDVARLGTDEIAYFLLWLIAYLRRHAEHRGWIRDSRLHLFLLVDDLQQLLATETRSPLPAKLIVLRQRGVHLCSMVHNFSTLSRIAKGNIDLVCHVGPLADYWDRRAFLEWAGLRDGPDVRSYLGRIGKGRGIVRHIKHPYPRPIAVRYHLIGKRDFGESLLERTRGNLLRDIRYDEPLALEELLVPPPSPASGSSSPRAIDGAGFVPGDADCVRRYLESVAQPLGWTLPQKAHLLNAGVGNSKEKRERLLRETYGLVKRYPKVNNGKGSGITLTELTVQGWKRIGRAPVSPPGKGSLPHKYYQYRTAKLLKETLRGYPAPRLEFRIGPHAYDLVQATPAGKLIGIEIAASEKDRNEAENAIDGLLPHAGRVCAHVVLAATDGAYRRARGDIEAALLLHPVRSRIHIERIGEVWSRTPAFVAKWGA